MESNASRFGNIPIRIEPNVKLTPENKCGFCTNSKCCLYVTQAIDTPRSKQDFEYLLWQVSHDSVRIFKDEDGWHLLFETPCSHLRPGGLCGIYEDRPQVCRDYSNDHCEFDGPAEDGFELYFDGYASLLGYCRKRFRRWGQS